MSIVTDIGVSGIDQASIVTEVGQGGTGIDVRVAEAGLGVTEVGVSGTDQTCIVTEVGVDDHTSISTEVGMIRTVYCYRW